MKRACRWLAAAGALLLGVMAHGAIPGRPNFVVLVADDWGFTDVGAFGSEIATPNLDALARRGVRFANFHVAASCSPTRSMLLTGVDNHRNGVGNLLESMPRGHAGKPGYRGSLNPNVVTIASLLQDGGYRTMIAGKWNVGSEPWNLPDQRGFARSIVQGDTGSDNWEPAKRYLPHSATVQWFEDGKAARMPAEYYSSEYFVDRTIGYLREGKDQGKPFFAYVGFQANHVPLQAPRAFIDKYRGRYQEGWSALRTARRDRAAALGLVPSNAPMVTLASTADWNRLSAADKAYEARRMEVYAGMADAMDFHVGRLVAHLRETGEYDNTVFVFLSDNGPEGSDYQDARLWLWTQYAQDIERMGGKGGYGVMGPSWASAAAAPLATYKFYGGEGGLRVPLIIAGPAGIQQGRISQGFAHVNDIVPTLLELAGIPVPGSRYKGLPIEPIAGRSLLPMLRGEAAGVYPPTQAIGYELSGNQALFKGDLKLVRSIPPLGDGQWHLYDIVRDPGETMDLQARLPEEWRTMQDDYAAYASSHGVLPMPPGYDPVRQVLVNSLRNYWIPAYGIPVSAVAAVMLALAGWWWMRRRKSARRH